MSRRDAGAAACITSRPWHPFTCLAGSLKNKNTNRKVRVYKSSSYFVYDSHNNGWPKYIHTFQTFCLTASQLIHMFGTLFTFNGCYCLMRAIYSNFIRDLGMFVKAFLWYSRLLTAFAQATAIFFRNPLKLQFELRSRWR